MTEPIEINTGSCHSNIELERRVDTVIIRQGDNVIELDEYFVKGLRMALFTLAPRA